MALKVWLPLNGNLILQGTANTTFSGTPAWKTYGKIGNAALNLLNRITCTTAALNGIQFFSVTFWVRIENNPDSTANWMDIIGFTDLTSSGSNGQFRFETGYGNTAYSGVHWHDNATNAIINGSYTYNTGTEFDKWHHIAVTISDTAVCSYYDGVLKSTLTANLNKGHLTGAWWLGEATTRGCILDVRIYNHALSAAEVHEISLGLVLHYKLDHAGSGTNLIINGDGSAGTTNWSNTNNISSEVPSSACSHSFFNNQTTLYISINPFHQYHIEELIKAASGATGTCYPSLLPYDIDKNFISTAHMSFNSATLTTLTQLLKAGDTKIYVASLANWNANSGHYYNYAAIFSYKDSTGYTYPDLGYTQNTPAFGSGTNAKTNLDKTNNIITLNSAYTGPTMPVGTKVCASTDGSTYWYPYGGINMTTITDWTTKSYNFIPLNDARLRYARYVRYYTYANTNVYHTGIKLVDLTDTTGVEDSSGYNHNGTIVGLIDIAQAETRYTQCLRWNSSSPTDNSDTGICYIQTPFTLTTPLQMSIAWWAKPESGYGGSTSHAAFCTSNNASRPTDYNTTAFHHRDTGFDIYPSDASGVKRLSFTYTANAWHHYVITYDGSTAKAYLDGVLKTSVAIGTDKTLATFSQLYIGFSLAGGVRRKTRGNYSDFRIYITALNADDILQLYHTSAKVDNKGNIHSYEFIESTSNIIQTIESARTQLVFNNGLSRYTQTYCLVTLTNDGYRIYREPNKLNSSSGGANNMWGGLKLVNLSSDGIHVYNSTEDNVWKLLEGHTYLWGFHAIGQSSNAVNPQIESNMGWDRIAGVGPNPTTLAISGIPENFLGEKDCFQVFTITDTIVKTATSTQSSYTQGNSYLSYRHFCLNYGYTNTGTLGTDLYLTNFRLYDITNIIGKITKKGQANFSGLVELLNKALIRSKAELLSTNFIEI